MKTHLLLAILLISFSTGCFAQTNDSLSIRQQITDIKTKALDSSTNENPLYWGGQYLRISGYMECASIGTGVAAGILALSANDKSGNTKDQLRTAAYIAAAFAVTFELASIAYRMRAGRQFKFAATTKGASAILTF